MNPFNGIERLRTGLQAVPGGGVSGNPFNGIESRMSRVRDSVVLILDENPFNGIESIGHTILSLSRYNSGLRIHSMELKVRDCLGGPETVHEEESIQWN